MRCGGGWLGAGGQRGRGVQCGGEVGWAWPLCPLLHTQRFGQSPWLVAHTRRWPLPLPTRRWPPTRAPPHAGIGGTGFVIECLTDNVNRSASDVKAAITKAGGKVGRGLGRVPQGLLSRQHGAAAAAAAGPSLCD